jgi:hypothetical protein
MPDQRRSSGALVVATAVVLLVALPLLYVLSVGPADRIHASASPQAQHAIEIAYVPLRLLYEAVPPLQPALDWYLNLWH